MHRFVVLLVMGGFAHCGSSPRPAPATAPAKAAPAIPCFPDRTAPLEAITIYKDLEKQAMSWLMPDDERPPPEPYGTCTVADSKITTADGTVVAELSCGVHVLVPGIRDDLGLALGTGARGQDVLDRSPGHPPLSCWANGPAQTRCRFDRPDDAESDTDSSSYVVAGSFSGDALTGADAEVFFAPRELVELDVSVWCH